MSTPFQRPDGATTSPMPKTTLDADLPHFSLDNLWDVWDGLFSHKPNIHARDAVRTFLKDMKLVCDVEYPVWREHLVAYVSEVDADGDRRFDILSHHDLKLYFYAAAISIEAIKVFELFETEIVEEVMSELSEQIDQALGYTGRAASDLCFDMFRTLKLAERTEMIQPHDQAVKWIIRLIGLERSDLTHDMSEDIVFRQDMAEPIARCFRHWWLGLKDEYRITVG